MGNRLLLAGISAAAVMMALVMAIVTCGGPPDDVCLHRGDSGSAGQDAPPPSAAAEGSAFADSLFETLLTQKFAPILYIGEDDPYNPEDVRMVWNSSTLVCKHVTRGVDLSCLSGHLRGSEDLSPFNGDHYYCNNYYLDLPGDADASKAKDDYAGLSESYDDTTYAHLTKDGNHIVVQYWFYYYFNSWNDLSLHEGDWEMIELVFDASACADTESCVSRILMDDTRPTLAAYSQHACRETRNWSEVRKDPLDPDHLHPLVLVGVGSHANYFEPFTPRSLTGACAVGVETAPDLTAARLVLPRVVVLPNQLIDDELLNTEFEWLAFKGRWGQWEKPGCPKTCDGPTGPRVKKQWTAPYSWATQGN